MRKANGLKIEKLFKKKDKENTIVFVAATTTKMPGTETLYKEPNNFFSQFFSVFITEKIGVVTVCMLISILFT